MPWNDDESAGPVHMLELVVFGAANVVPAISLKAPNDLAGIGFDDGQGRSNCANICATFGKNKCHAGECRRISRRRIATLRAGLASKMRGATMMPMRPGIVVLSCAIAGLVASAALAQIANYTSVEATAGKPVQLTYHGRLTSSRRRSWVS